MAFTSEKKFWGVSILCHYNGEVAWGVNYFKSFSSWTGKCSHFHCRCVLYRKTHIKEKGDLCSFSTVLLKQAQPEAANSLSQFLSTSTLPLSLKNYLAADENYQTKGVMTGLL